MAFPKCSDPNKAGNKTCTVGKGEGKGTFTMHAKATGATRARRSRFASSNRDMRFTAKKRFVCPRDAKGRFKRGCRPTPAMRSAMQA